MLTPDNAKERIFCPICGKDGVYDATGERDWWCNPCNQFVNPLRERHLQGEELIRLRLENEQLREMVKRLQKTLDDL